MKKHIKLQKNKLKFKQELKNMKNTRIQNINKDYKSI